MRVVSLFSGIGAYEDALKQEGFEFELVGYCEKDKYASASFSAIHEVSEDLNLGDITELNPNEVPECEMICYSPPCQDISTAGKMAGMEKGTRSSLYTYALDIIREKKPKFAIMENVKNLVGKKFKKYFDEILGDLESMGYTNYWKVLNTKEHGLPQNRERVFLVSVLDVDVEFEFPESYDSGIRLKDLLELEVDEKYYVSDDKCQKLLEQLKRKTIDEYMSCSNAITANYANSLATDEIEKHRRQVAIVQAVGDRGSHSYSVKDHAFTIPANPMSDRGQLVLENKCIKVGNINNCQSGDVYDPNGISSTLCANGGGMGAKTGLYLIDETEPKIIEDFYSNRDIRVYDESPTIRADRHGLKLLQNYRIRKLTPLECWRLQGFSDNAFYKAKKRLEQQFYKGKDRASSQLYKQAGNSISVTVLIGIFRKLLKGGNKRG